MVSVVDVNKKFNAMLEPSNYINNMLLPERVQATRHQPLGPDCIIAPTEIVDQPILRTVQYYWYISHEKGCVECVVKSNQTGKVSTLDPKCVITRKNRRFEAYCCTLCRQNFVTVVQALLHLKAVHRPNNKILIQDKDVFENIDKAMEVPPVPLPWHIARKIGGEPDKNENNGINENLTPNFVIPPGSIPAGTTASTILPQTLLQTPPLQKLEPSVSPIPNTQTNVENKTSKDTVEPETNAMLQIILALACEFNRHIAALSFNDEKAEVNVAFVDGTKVIARAPDLFVDCDEPTEKADEKLAFTTLQTIRNEQNEERIVLKANNAFLARKYLKHALSEGLAESTTKKGSKSALSPNRKDQISSESDHDSGDQKCPSPETKSKPVNRQTKSVRFMLGAPESSDDENPEPERRTTAAENKARPLKEKRKAAQLEKPAKDAAIDGSLENVVEKMIATASKGRILPPAPTSPLATSAVQLPYVSPASLPSVGSSPALSNLSPLSINQAPKLTSTLTRNQSWTPSVAGTAFSVASIRRPYTARGFTYAEKIELMKQQNNYDEEFMTKHIKTATSVPNKPNPPITSTALNNIKQRVADGIKKHRRGKRLDRRPKADSVGSSSDSDHPFMEQSSSDEHLQSFSRKKKKRNPSSDSDDGPPSLVASTNVMSGFQSLLQNHIASGMFTPHSEYYGSGEWASAAMETLKNLQSSIEGVQQIDRKKETHQQTVDCHANSAEHDANSSSDKDEYEEAPSTLKVKLPLSSRKRSKSNDFRPSDGEQAVDSKRSRASDQCESDTESKVKQPDLYHQLPRHKYFQKNSPGPKHGISPLARNLDKQVAVSGTRSFSAPSASTLAAFPLKQKKGLAHQLIQKNKVMGSKCSSDPALSSSDARMLVQEGTDMSLTRISEEPVTPLHSESKDSGEEIFAKSGDQLVFVKDFPSNPLSHENPLMMKYQRSAQNAQPKSETNVPEVFRNCVDTYFKVQLVQKLHVCKVCGFSVPADESPSSASSSSSSLPASGSSQGEKALKAHVMEHSLKELYETGYEIGQL